MSQSKEMTQIIYRAMDDKKAENIKIIDISNVSILADYFVIATGNNPNQIHAMADEIEEKLAKGGYTSRKIEGYDHASWVLMDYQDVIVHIFDKESRSFYDLERIWSDGKIVTDIS